MYTSLTTDLTYNTSTQHCQQTSSVYTAPKKQHCQNNQSNMTADLT